jgi:hypothetical protein
MMGRPSIVLAGLAAVVFAAAGGIAYASIPDAGTGKYHACLKQNGTIRIIDPAVDACNPVYETEITFNKQGPQGDPGPPGANGISPTVQQLSAGDAHCSAGGAAITGANGTTAYVCSGQPFSGTFTSPNGKYTISVLDTGITVMGPSARFTIIGNDVRIDHSDNIDVRASNDLTLDAGNDLSARAGINADLRAAVNTVVRGEVQVGIQGATVSVNNGPTCAPAARAGDPILGTADSSGNVTGQVLVGSPTVCIG